MRYLSDIPGFLNEKLYTILREKLVAKTLIKGRGQNYIRHTKPKLNIGKGKENLRGFKYQLLSKETTICA